MVGEFAERTIRRSILKYERWDWYTKNQSFHSTDNRKWQIKKLSEQSFECGALRPRSRKFVAVKLRSALVAWKFWFQRFALRRKEGREAALALRPCASYHPPTAVGRCSLQHDTMLRWSHMSHTLFIHKERRMWLKNSSRSIVCLVDLSVRLSLTRVRHLPVGRLRPYRVTNPLQITSWQKSIHDHAFHSACSLRTAPRHDYLSSNVTRHDRYHTMAFVPSTTPGKLIRGANFKLSTLLSAFSTMKISMFQSLKC